MGHAFHLVLMMTMYPSCRSPKFRPTNHYYHSPKFLSRNHKSTVDNSNNLRAVITTTTTSVPREDSVTNVAILPPPLTSQRRRTTASAPTTMALKETPKILNPSLPNILTTTTTMMMKILSAPSKITHAVRTTKVHVCHYSSRDGYKTFCVPESDSDALRFY